MKLIQCNKLRLTDVALSSSSSFSQNSFSFSLFLTQESIFVIIIEHLCNHIDYTVYRMTFVCNPFIWNPFV